MSEQEYTLEEISYSKKEDCRIMEAVLNSWFEDPKSLNLASPSLNYPFEFKKWISKYYSINQEQIITMVLKKNNWIIGHVSIRIEKNNLHIYHLFIEPRYRGKGLTKKIMNTINKKGLSLKKATISLNVHEKNNIAITVYLKLGYKRILNSKKKAIIKMLKYL